MYTKQSGQTVRKFHYDAELCELVVDYGNGQENDMGIEEDKLFRFIQEIITRQFCLLYWSDLTRNDRLTLFGLPQASRVGLTEREILVVRMLTASRIGQKAARELLEERHEFRSAMRWLCSPKDPKRWRPKARKLFPSRWPFGRNKFISRIDEEHIRYLEAHGLEHRKREVWLMGGLLLPIPSVDHFIDLFCSFLISECSGLDSPEMPIKICQSCGKFFSALSLKGKARIRREYCSEKCQRAKWWTPEKRADDAFVKRLEKLAENSINRTHGYSITDLQNRLSLSKVKQRLAEIEEHWTGEWPPIVRRIRHVKAQAISKQQKKLGDVKKRKATERVLNGTKQKSKG